MSGNKNILKYLLLITLVSLAGCGSSGQLTSIWDENVIAIDGNSAEWLSELKHDKDNGIAYAFRNDKDFLYMCIVFIEPSKLMLMRSGAIIWFEGEDESKTFGIRYPLPGLSGEREGQNFDKEMFNRENINERTQQYFLKQTELSIVNKDKYPLGQFPIISNKEGIQTKVGYSNDRFVYELRVPLRGNKNHLYRIDAEPGENLSVQFETEEFDLEKMRGGGKSERGDMMPPGGGQRPRQGKGMARRDRVNPEPLNFSVKVQLVKK
ncbi:MAG: hypothetical protein AB1521_07045 [Bacteroidota bacterium]